MLLANLSRDIGLDGLIDVRENLQRHQLGDELVRFQSKLRRQFLDDDRRLDVNDFLLDFRFRGRNGGDRRGGFFRWRRNRLRLRRNNGSDRRRQRFRRGADAGNGRQERGLARSIAIRAFQARLLFFDERNSFHRRLRRGLRRFGWLRCGLHVRLRRRWRMSGARFCRGRRGSARCLGGKFFDALRLFALWLNDDGGLGRFASGRGFARCGLG